MAAIILFALFIISIPRFFQSQSLQTYADIQHDLDLIFKAIHTYQTDYPTFHFRDILKTSGASKTLSGFEPESPYYQREFRSWIYNRDTILPLQEKGYLTSQRLRYLDHSQTRNIGKVLIQDQLLPEEEKKYKTENILIAVKWPHFESVIFDSQTFEGVLEQKNSQSHLEETLIGEQWIFQISNGISSSGYIYQDLKGKRSWEID